jgi:hypothetical protein
MSSTATQTIELEQISLSQTRPHHESPTTPVMAGVPLGRDTISSIPTTEQRVFQQEPSSGMGNNRKIAILALIVTCNLVQVSNILDARS